MKKWNDSSHLAHRPIVHQYFPQHPQLMKGDGLYPNKSIEEIFDLLPDQNGDGEGEGGEGEGNGEERNSDDGADQPGSMEAGASEEDLEQAQRDWKRNVENAADKAKKAGNMPAYIEMLVHELNPIEKLNWRDITRDMSRDAKSKLSRTWSRFNRRRQDPMMPGYANDAILRLIILYDLSGSVCDRFRDMKTETAALLDEDFINEAVLIAVDTEPKSITIARNSQDVIDWTPRGGGGTNFDSAMKLIANDYPDAMGALFLTDLETSSFGAEPPFPVVWVNFEAHNKLKAPYGRTVDY
jgi:predicted metal-dependent peptidase